MELDITLQTGIALFTAVIHAYIFILESFLWTRPKTRKVFGMSETQAETTKGLAYNQGFYNLFLSIAIFYGLAMGQPGILLVNYAMASVGAAGLVLWISNPRLKRSAAIQLVPAILYFTLRALLRF